MTHNQFRLHHLKFKLIQVEKNINDDISLLSLSPSPLSLPHARTEFLFSDGSISVFDHFNSGSDERHQILLIVLIRACNQFLGYDLLKKKTTFYTWTDVREVIARKTTQFMEAFSFVS